MARLVKPREPHFRVQMREDGREVAIVGAPRSAYMWVGRINDQRGDIYTFSNTKTLREFARRLLASTADSRASSSPPPTRRKRVTTK
jgi:hypothetical protein